MISTAASTARRAMAILLTAGAALLVLWFVASDDARAFRGPGSLTLYVLLSSRRGSGGLSGVARGDDHGVVRPLPRQPRRGAGTAPRRSFSSSLSSSSCSSSCSPSPTVLPPHVRFDLVNGTCPVCAGPLGHEPLCHCARCATLHHERCFAWAGACSTYGCQCAVSRPGVPGAAAERPRARRRPGPSSRSSRRPVAVRPSFATFARDDAS